MLAILAVPLVLLSVGAVWLVQVAADKPVSYMPIVDAPTTTTMAPPPTTTVQPPPPPTTARRSTAVSHPSRSATSRPPASTPPHRDDDPAPPVPSHMITVGGPTLDNGHPRSLCTMFKNVRVDQAVEIVAVGVVGDHLVVSADDCPADDGDIVAFPATRVCRAGLVLRPGADGCFTGVALASGSPPGEHRGTIQLTVKTRCTSDATAPCSDDELPRPPSADDPIDIVWTEGGRVCRRAGEPDNPFCDIEES